jgi:hypothetical protein
MGGFTLVSFSFVSLLLQTVSSGFQNSSIKKILKAGYGGAHL